MRYLAIMFILLGCNEPTEFTVMMCPKDANSCQVSTFRFQNLQDCEEFIRQSGKIQPNVGRICVKAGRAPGVY